MLAAGGAAVVGGGTVAGLRQWQRHERGLRSDVLIARAPGYDVDLANLIGEGLKTLGIGWSAIRDKRVLLKPNLVETAVGRSYINTNPAVMVGAVEAFRRLGAREVIVAEGQGHRRDSWLVLDESGMGEALEAAGVTFIDMNHDEFAAVDNVGGWTSLESLHLPKAVLDADWVVSIPKLKTHHWVGVTCAMKNLFGVMPGVVYGWPKNVLHRRGIHESILDINATVKPALAIVDGIVGMEGDGPVMGTPITAGCLIMGRNLTAVDATAARVMGLDPYGVRYLQTASGRLGPIHECNIAQRGEPIDAVRTRFDVLDVPHLKKIVVG